MLTELLHTSRHKVTGPTYGVLKVWAWGFNNYELHGSLEFQEIHQTVKLRQAIMWAGIETMGILR